MTLIPEHREVVDELKKFTRELNLTQEQARRLHVLLSAAYESLHEYKLQNPNASTEEMVQKVTENKATIRQQAAIFLTPEQITKWDFESAKAQDFLGHKLAA